MNVGTQSHVVGEIPTYVIGVVIKGDVVPVPPPIATVSGIGGRYVEIIAPEPETARTASLQMPDMTRAKSAVEMPVLPRMVEMETHILASPVVSHPLAIRMNVRTVGMIIVVPERTVRISRGAVILLWSTAGNIAVVGVVMISFPVIVLGETAKRKEQTGSQKGNGSYSHQHLGSWSLASKLLSRGGEKEVALGILLRGTRSLSTPVLLVSGMELRVRYCPKYMTCMYVPSLTLYARYQPGWSGSS